MKSRRQHATHRAKTSRRWHVPPPLIHGTEPLEGGTILQEWNGRLGVVLWQTFRDTLLWTTCKPSRRGEAFSDRAGSLTRTAIVMDLVDDATVSKSLAVLGDMVSRPTEMQADQVSRACRKISNWASRVGRLQTALAFAQTSALASRSDSGAAFWVATIAVRLNDHARAEIWFRRAVGFARRSRDWRMYSRAFTGLGNLYMRRGNLPSAQKLHTRALRGARRGGMRREQAAALHDLFVVMGELGQPAEAEKLAAEALAKYGTRSGRVHVLAHDVAYFWMERGHFGRALNVFTAVLPVITNPSERLFVLADIARAAGGTGNAQTASQAAQEVAELIDDPELQHGAARALLEVAHGYVSLGDTDNAEAAANDAIAFAERFREGKTRLAAESLLDSLTVATQPPVRESAAEEETVGHGDQLAADFVRTLQMIAGATH